MKIAFGCDHGGFIYKEAVINYLKNSGHEVVDFGTFSEDSCDYPDYAVKVTNAVVSKDCIYGVLICGTGIGMSIVANKVKGIRCAHVTDEFSAEMTRRHNNANVLALGARISKIEDCLKFVEIFLNTPFDGGRHQTRVSKISDVENKNLK